MFHLVNTASLLFFAFLSAINLRAYAPPPPDAEPLRPDESLFVLIPCRNEAENIGELLDGLLRQTFPNFRILVLDDDSEDGTEQIVREVASKDFRIGLLKGKPIELGWAGKVWASSQLGEVALERGAEWLLFLDADTRVQPQLIASSLFVAQSTSAGMVSTFPYQITGSPWEEIVLPMIHFLICTFLPLPFVWKTKWSAFTAACGQFELFSSQTYRAIGGHASISGSFHDGLQLARRVKQSGSTVRLFDGSPLMSCRMYQGGRAVWSGFTRNAYEGLGGFIPLLGMTFLQITLFLMPFVFVLKGVMEGILYGRPPASLPWCAIQVALILWIRATQTNRFGHKRMVLLHPISVISLVAIQWGSFFKSVFKSKTVWKGRQYG